MHDDVRRRRWMSQPVQEVTVPEPQTLEVGGGHVSYRRRGSGTPTLFLHSAGGSGEWGPFHDALADGRDLIIPDHPGFGGTDDFSSRSEEHTSELQSLMRISYAVFCLKKKKTP